MGRWRIGLDENKGLYQGFAYYDHSKDIFSPIEINKINGAENVSFVCQLVLQVYSYKIQTLCSTIHTEQFMLTTGIDFYLVIKECA